MKDLAVIGPEDFVLGFQLAGVRKAWVAYGPEYQSRVEEILAKPKDTAILIARADDVEHLPPTLRKKLADSIDPVVIQMGSSGGDLREKVKRAIGIDLYKE